MAVAIVLAAAAGCTTISEESRISTPLAASEFNDVASRYMERPTFVSLATMSDGQTVLKVQMDDYGSGYDATLGVAMDYVMFFDKRFAADYVGLIDKYLEWAQLATERGDQLEREVGRTRTWGQGGTIEMRFKLYSGNAQNQYLVIETCAVGTCSDRTMTFTPENARILRDLLKKLGEGRIAKTDIDAVYR
ncbi:MAG: hypothetical protein R3C52_10485 [Hyphomonadaceae bacterium]